MASKVKRSGTKSPKGSGEPSSEYVAAEESVVLRPRKQAIVAKELKRIVEKGVALTKESVLESATAPGSPLHGMFEWDDSKAGLRYRLVQATAMIIAARLVWGNKAKRLEAGAQIRVRAFPSLGVGEGFAERQVVLTMEEQRKHLIRGKLSAIRSAINELADIDEVSGFRESVLEAVDEVARALDIRM